MRVGPTLADLRDKAQKERHREIGNWLARRVGRPSALYGTWVAVRLGLTANQVTLMALLANLGAAVSVGTGSRWGFVLGVLLAHMAFWLDHVDGQIARWRGTSSLDGVYFDYMMHHVASLTLGFALGHGLGRRPGESNWSIAGFAIALGWLGLSLHNDCRYKAIFQRLKREVRRIEVQGGGGARPTPPSRWPRRGLGVLTWPLYKLCEPHAVLIVLTGIGGLITISEPGGMFCWRALVVIMAVVAPVLAVARSWRSIHQGLLESEFERWFPEFEKRSSAG